MDWHVDITMQAENDIEEIFRHIAFILEEPDIAWAQIRRIREQINKLDRMPERFPVVDEDPWKTRGVRRVNVDRYSAFYALDEESGTVIVMRVFYARRDVSSVLQGY